MEEFQIIYFGGKKFLVLLGVYKPAEDTFLLAENLEVKPEDTVLDLGTGCGILAILSSQKAKEVVALDISRSSVKCAKLNAQLNGEESRTEFICGDLFGPFRKKPIFDLILFNAPYLPGNADDAKDLVDRAWYGGADGRRVIDAFLDAASKYLKKGGRIFLVQSTLSNVDETLERLRRLGFNARTIAKEASFFETITLIEARID